jgi:outer membrane lipoprotein-sorting protein
MKSIIKIWALVLAMIVSVTVNAQTDAKSKVILQNVEKLYKSYKTIQTEFKITTKVANRKPSVASGSLWLKGIKFKVKYDNQEVYCDGKTIWSYNPTDEEVTLEDYRTRTNNLSPQEIFTFFNQGFKANYEGPVTSGKSTRDVIKLVPKKRKEKYAYIKIEVEKGTYKLRRVIQHYKNGTDVVIDLGDVQGNKTINDAIFTWDTKAHPGVQVVDLR